jgi:hypothetical protein
MNFRVLQQTVRDAIAGHATFAPDADITVLKDNGASKADIERAFLTKGYSVAVWPAVRGKANSGDDSAQGVNTQTIVRLCINPQTLKAVRAANVIDPSKPKDGEYINDFVADIISSVLAIAPFSPPGVRFQLDADAFELVSFDEGMITYHIRFTRFVVFGT